MTQNIDEPTNASYDVHSALAKLQELLPEGYEALNSLIGGNKNPDLSIGVPDNTWALIRDPRGYVWLDEVEVPLPFVVPSQIDGFRVRLERKHSSLSDIAKMESREVDREEMSKILGTDLSEWGFPEGIVGSVRKAHHT